MKELEDLIKRAILELVKKYQINKRDTIHITDLTTCLRKSYYTKKYGFPMDEKTAFRILFGVIVHELLTPVIAEYLNGKREVRTTYKYQGIEIQATPDVLANDVVVELKTCNKLPYSPYKTHLEQLNAYLHIFNVPKGLIVYISRTQLGVRIFDYYGNADLFYHTMEKARILKYALDKDVPPPCNISISARKTYCKDCPFKNICVSDSELSV